MDKAIKLFKIIIITALLITSTGCWNRRELNEIAIISAGGVDVSEDMELALVYQFVNPSAIASTVGATPKTPFVTMKTPADTIFEAARLSSSEISRRLYFGHMQILVINEKFAKEKGIRNVLDVFYRDHEIREDILIFIATDTTTDKLLSTQTILENNTGIAIMDHINNSYNSMGDTRPIELRETINTLISSTSSLVLPIVHLRPPIQKSTLEMTQNSKQESILMTMGFAVFKEDKLIDSINRIEARSLNFITDNLNKTLIVIPYKGANNSIEVQNSITKVETSLKNGKPEVLVDIKIEGNIGEINTPVDIMDPASIIAFQSATNKVIHEQLIQLIEKTQQELKVDIFHFGEIFARQHPKEFAKLEATWEKEFIDLAINVKVNTTIRQIGMKNQPFQLEMKGNKK